MLLIFGVINELDSGKPPRDTTKLVFLDLLYDILKEIPKGLKAPEIPYSAKSFSCP